MGCGTDAQAPNMQLSSTENYTVTTALVPMKSLKIPMQKHIFFSHG